MSEVIKHLNPSELARLDAQVDSIAHAPTPHLDPRSGKQFLFVAHFDGTNNDKDNLQLSGNPLPTNVAELWAQMKPLEAGNDNFRTNYYPGVGTDPGVKGYRDVLVPGAEMRDTAGQAYADFQLKASDWLRAHPEANPAESLKVMATGFSRGGGTAAVFSQLLYERGLTDPQTGKTLVPPGQLGLAGSMIYDPVTTGYDGNSAFSPTSKNISVVQAQNEYRTLFKGVDHSGHPGITVVPVTGNHCNIGGGYDRGIGAKVLEASTEWFRQTGTPITDVPPGKRYDSSATVYHERDLPKTDVVAGVSQHPLARSAFPLGSRVLEGAAQRADYPVTHDPRNGLHAQRELDPAARPERRQDDGWQRFDGVQGTVWRKNYTSDKGVPLSAVVVERDLPGKANDRVDMFLSRRDGQGGLLLERQLPADSGKALRESLDQRLDPKTRSRAEGLNVPSNEQQSRAQQFKDQLGPRLAQLGMSPGQINTLAAAVVTESSRFGEQGEVSRYLLSRDGSTIAVQQNVPPLREFSVADALARSPAEHWREAVALNRESQRQVRFDDGGQSPTFAVQAQPEARAMA